MPEVVVPRDRLFMMGDNRDDPADSRFTVSQGGVSQGGVGLLPLWNLVGRVRLVTASRDTEMPDRGAAAWLLNIRTDRFISLMRRFQRCGPDPGPCDKRQLACAGCDGLM